MLEFYQAYANYHDLMDLTEELIKTVAQEVNGTTLTTFNGTEIDLSDWTKLSMREAIIKFWPSWAKSAPVKADFDSSESFVSWLQNAASHYSAQNSVSESNASFISQSGLSSFIRVNQLYSVIDLCLADIEKGAPYGKSIAAVFELVAEAHLIQPTIIYDFPLAVSPLSKIKPNEPDWVERFEFYIGGFEVGNAFSELNDPDDQRNRFLAQLAERDRGDDEAMQMDEDYVRALGYGLPPTAGEGIGIDRLTMLLTNSKSIRDVILFPLMRPQTKQADTSEGKHGESAE